MNENITSLQTYIK